MDKAAFEPPREAFNFEGREVMKLEREIRDECVRNIRHRLDEMKKEAERILSLMERAETFEAFMEFKKELILEILEHLPLSAATCPFCLKYEYDLTQCLKCEYAKVHGICGRKGSTFEIINSTLETLKHAVMSYYRGEEYDEDWRKFREEVER